MNTDKIYKDLKKKYTDEEIAESFVFPSNLTPEEQAKQSAELSKYIKERQKQMTWKQKLQTRYYCYKFRLEDWLNKIKSSD